MGLRTIRPLFLGFLSATALLLASTAAYADTTFHQGSLASPTDIYELTFNLAAQSDVAIQTFGFGGGTSQTGQQVDSGGFDPFVALFSGTGAGATIVDGSADVVSNFSQHVGCPNANTAVVGPAGAMCGDVRLDFTGLTAGDYTLTLSDAGYQPNAVTGVDPNTGLPFTTLGDGFNDVGAAFQTCNFPANPDFDNLDQYCVNTSSNWAFDLITASLNDGGTTATPEPATLALLGGGLSVISGLWRRRSRKSH